MTDREVMQQALDALLGYKPHSLTHAKEQGSAIIALRAAIAQPEQSAPVHQPLAHAEITKAYDESMDRWVDQRINPYVRFARAIEAAHGITTLKAQT